MKIPTAWLVLLSGFGLGGCGGFSDPESAVRTVVEKEIAWDKDHLDEDVKKARAAIETWEKEMEWHADRGTYAQRIDQVKAMIDFYEENLSKIRDSYSYDIINIRQPDPANDSVKEVTVKRWNYDVRKGNGPKDFYLEYESKDLQYTFKKVENKWKLQKGTYKPDFKRG